MWKVCRAGWGLAGGPPGLSHPFLRFWESGVNAVFLCQSAAPSPGGVGTSAAGLLAGEAGAAEPGRSLQTLTVFFLCGSSRSHAPPLQAPGILLSPALGRAKALGKEIDRGLAPSKAALLGPSMIHCPLPGRGGGGRWTGQQVGAGCKLRLEFSGELFTLQSCGILTHSKGRRVLNAFSKDLGTVPDSGGTIRKSNP